MSAGEIDHDTARELVLFIENDYQLYRSQYQPIVKNLARKKAKGIYDSKKAVKVVVYLVENGRKKYKKDYADLGPMNAATKEAAAKDLLAGMQEEISMALEKIPSKKKKGNPGKRRKIRKKRGSGKKRRSRKTGIIDQVLKAADKALSGTAVKF